MVDQATQERLAASIHAAHSTCRATAGAMRSLSYLLETVVPKSMAALNASAESLSRANRILHHEIPAAVPSQVIILEPVFIVSPSPASLNSESPQPRSLARGPDARCRKDHR